MTSSKFFVEHAIQKCFAKSAQNQGIPSVQFETENLDWSGEGFNSDMLLGQIVYEDEQGRKRCGDSILVKLMPSSKGAPKSIDITFRNEIFVYSRIIPFFAKFNKDIWNIFPKFYYGSETISSDNQAALIILENLSASGYRMTKTRTFLSIEELRLIVKKLANFHAYSYYLKSKSSKEFYSLVSNLTETHYCHTGEKPGYLNISSDYFIDMLSKDEQYREKVELIRDLLKDTDKFMSNLYTIPEEPMAVVCHGDFLRNNLMFKYSSAGQPEDVKFFDLACCRYSSPIVDLALILYMNTNQQTRDLYWDELIDIYCASLQEPFPDNAVPSKEQVVEEFKINSLSAFVIVAFFLPDMMRYDEIPNYHLLQREDYLPDFQEFVNSFWFEIPNYVLREVHIKRQNKPHHEQMVLKVLKDIIDRGFV